MADYNFEVNGVGPSDMLQCARYRLELQCTRFVDKLNKTSGNRKRESGGPYQYLWADTTSVCSHTIHVSKFPRRNQCVDIQYIYKFCNSYKYVSIFYIGKKLKLIYI